MKHLISILLIIYSVQTYAQTEVIQISSKLFNELKEKPSTKVYNNTKEVYELKHSKDSVWIVINTKTGELGNVPIAQVDSMSVIFLPFVARDFENNGVIYHTCSCGGSGQSIIIPDRLKITFQKINL